MKIICLRLLGVLVFVLSFSINLNSATPKLCSYEPDLDKPNPLGIKGYITIAQEEGDTAVIYEELPVRMADKIAMYDQQELIFDALNVEETRKLLLVHPEYYSKLVGHNIPEGFGPVNALLTCE